MSGTNTFSTMIKVTGGAPPPPPPPPPPPSNIFPDPDLDRADTANWSTVGLTFIGTSGSISSAAPDATDSFNLEPFEADGTALLTAISNGVDYTVALTISGFVGIGTLGIILGGGTAVNFVISGNGVTDEIVTAGDGTFGAFRITGSGSGPICTIDAISVIVV